MPFKAMQSSVRMVWGGQCWGRGGIQDGMHWIEETPKLGVMVGPCGWNVPEEVWVELFKAAAFVLLSQGGLLHAN